jgi:tripartite-type tricarboxylate transporter receptor subunit TctC
MTMARNPSGEKRDHGDHTRRALMLAALAAAAVPAARAAAPAFPTQPLRILVGFSPGSPSDLLARGLAEALAPILKQTVVVENKAGSGGLLAARALLQAGADGHTLMVVSAAYAALPVIGRNLGFDPLRDLVGITRIADVPSILVATPSLGTPTLAALLERLKQNPAGMNYATPGNGSANHFAMEYLLAQARVRAVHVPYRGVPEAVAAVMSGECGFSFVPVPNALPQVQAGKLLALATSTSTRAKPLPAVPTVAEAGVVGYRFDPWFGLLAPAAVPEPVRARLVAASVAALAAPALRARFEPLGAEIRPLPGKEFDAYIQTEIAKLRYIAATARIEAS